MVDQLTAEDLDGLRELYADDASTIRIVELAIQLRTELAELRGWRERAVTQARRAIWDTDRFHRLYDPEQPDIALVIDSALDDRDAARARVTELESFVVDLAFHGARHDLNPTMDCTSTETVYAGMANYLRRIDTAIRNRAKALLPQKEGKSNG